MKRFKPPINVQNPHQTDRKLSLPVFVACCSLGRALRPFNFKGSRFVAVLVMPKEEVDVFVAAASQLLREMPSSSSRHQADDRIRVLKDGEDAADIVLRSRDGYWPVRMVLFLHDRAAATEELSLAADVVAEVEPARVEHVRAASRLLYGANPSDGDIEFLLSQSPHRQVSAFRPGRSFDESLRRLRQVTMASQPAVSPEVVQDGPGLAELHGYGEAAEWGFDLAADLRDWREGVIGWSEVDRGALLSGPPGTGKTLYAAALASTCGVQLVATSSGEWQQAGYLNATLKAMESSFKRAERLAPSILFIDEIDAVGSRLGTRDHNSDYTRQLIARLLQLLDGHSRREGTVVIGACNFPDHLDPAIKRPGRLDREFIIGRPDQAARTGILAHHSGLEFEGAARSEFVERSRGMTGADIEQVVRNAKRVARKARTPLNAAYILGKLPPFIQLTPEYIRRTAVHEAGHAIVAASTGRVDVRAIAVSDATLASEVRQSVGAVALSSDSTGHFTRQHYLDLIACALGGISAELEVYGDITDGAAGSDDADLPRATYLATLVEGVFGMGSRLVSCSSTDFAEVRALLTRDPALQTTVNLLLSEQLLRARRMINDRRPALDELVNEVLVHKRLNGHDVEKILARHAKRPWGRRHAPHTGVWRSFSRLLLKVHWPLQSRR